MSRGSLLRIEPLEERRMLTGGIVELGPSDNVALDQPRVAIEVLQPLVAEPDYYNPAHWGSVGPGIFNTLLLDTGANGILAMATAVADMVQPPYVYHTQGVFLEAGVAGDHLMDISVPYRFDFAGTDGVRNTIFDARLLSDANNDFSIFGPWGLAGMPAMVNRVTTLDLSGWSTSAPEQELFMRVGFSDDLPAGNGHRYSVAVDNRLQFDPLAQTISGDPPAWGDIPFLTAIPTYNGVGLEGNFLFDTGAQVSVISEQLAFDLGLDANGNGTLDDEATRFETVGGVGGTVTAPVVYIDEVRVPTEQGVDLVWTDLQWLVLDIEVPGETTTLDGVFGSDLLTSGWVEAFFEGKEDGYFQQLHFDFRQMDDNGTGTIHFDLTPASDVVIPPGPGVRLLETLGYTEVAENGSEDYFRLVLTSEPASDVVVEFVPRSAVPLPENAQLTVLDDALGTTAVTFTPANWNVPQLVRVDAVNDDAAEGVHTDWVDFTIVSTDPDYNGFVLPSADVTILDDDTSVLIFGETGDSTIVGESGLEDTYTVRLKETPSYQVWVELSNAAGQVHAYDPAQSEELNNILFFDSSNWNVPQTVRVEAINDTTPEGPHHTHILHEAVEVFSDFSYQPLGLSLLRVDVEDDDVGSVAILESDGSTDVSEDGQIDTYTIVLNEAPTASVRIDFTTLDGQVTAVDNAEPLNAFVEFSTSDWNVPRTVRVAAIDDDIDEGSHEDRVFHSVSSVDTRFDGISLTPLSVRISDNDQAGLLITETDGSTIVGHNGGHDNYTIVLTSQPTANVRVELGDAGGQLQVVDDAHRGNSFVDFTPQNWNVAQTVRVSGGPNGYQQAVTQVLVEHELLSTDANYRGSYPLTVQVLDNGLQGTTGDDVITVEPGIAGTSLHRVTINGSLTTYDPAVFTTISIDALGGSDTITIVGTPSAETATLNASSVNMLGPAYEVNAVSVETIYVYGGASDTASLTGDAAGNNTFKGRPTYSELEGPTSYHYVSGFGAVTGTPGGGSNNRALLYGSAGADVLTASASSAVIDWDGVPTATATGFNEVLAFGGAGDSASLTGNGAGGNTLYGRPAYTELKSPAFYLYAGGFDTVTATPGGGINNRALLYGGTGADTFTATTTSAVMDLARAPSITANGFNMVMGIGSSGDTADLTGNSAGDNFLQSRLAYTNMSGASYYYLASGFQTVTAASGGGTNNRAFFYNDPAASSLTADPTTATMDWNGTASATVSNFDRVFGFGSTGDTATFTGNSGGNNTFEGRPDYNALTGTGYYHYANGFDTMSATAGGGTNNRVFVYGGTGADTLSAGPTTGTMTWNGGRVAQMSGFDKVFGYGSIGDTANLSGDAAATNTFDGYSTYSTLYSAAFYHYVSGFDLVTATAGSATGDRANLYDSVLNDLFTSSPGSGHMDYGDDGSTDISVLTFERIHTRFLNGGNDDADLTDSAAVDQYIGTGANGQLTDAAAYWLYLYFDSLGTDTVTLNSSDTGNTVDASTLDYVLNYDPAYWDEI